MRLSEERSDMFRKLWSEVFGEELSTDEARQKAALLVELYASLAEPLPRERRSTN